MVLMAFRIPLVEEEALWMESSGGISSNATQAGGGGSSYISGHPGCVKYDKYVFTNTKMIDGNGFVWTDVKGELEKCLILWVDYMI